MKTIPLIIVTTFLSTYAHAGEDKDAGCDKVAFQMGMVYSTAATREAVKRPSRVAASN